MSRRILRAGALAVMVALAAAACGNDADDAIEDAAPEERTDEQEPVEIEPCEVTIPGDQAVDDELVAILPDPEEAWERLGFTACLRRLATARSLFDTSRAAEVLAESGLEERFEQGVAHDFDHPQGFSLGGIRTHVVLLDDEASAREAVSLLLPALLESADEIEEPVEPGREIPVEGLGEESFALRGSTNPDAPGFDVARFVWSRGNLVLEAIGWGPGGEADSAPEPEVLEIARGMDERAR